MTSLLMAALVDRGKLAWDSPVSSLYPRFALGDAEATRKLTLKHTVCACTGLPRQDLEFLFEYRGVTPERRLEEMRAMKPTTGFGEAFQYSNPMVSAGGTSRPTSSTRASRSAPPTTPRWRRSCSGRSG
jgi:CubicO group peptidase (beta-lactamase class C family)